MVKISEDKLRKLITEIVAEEIREFIGLNNEIDTFIEENISSFLAIVTSTSLTEERGLPNNIDMIFSKIIGYCENMVISYKPVQSGQISYWAFTIPFNFFKNDNFFLGDNVRMTVFIVDNPNNITFQGRENLLSFFNGFKSELNNDRLENVDFRFSVVLDGHKDWKPLMKKVIYHEVTHAYKVWALQRENTKYYENIEIPSKARMGKFSSDLLKDSRKMNPTQVDLLTIFQYIGADERNAYLSGAYVEMEDYIKKHPTARKQEIVSNTTPVIYYKDIMRCLSLISKENDNDETIINAVNTVFNKQFRSKTDCIKWLEIQIKQLGLFIFKKLSKLYGRVLQDREQK